jgi:hypothetical protein
VLTTDRLARLVHRERYTEVLAQLERNGRPGLSAAAARLRPEDRGLLALGLALRRCLELSYSPDAATQMVALRLGEAVSAVAAETIRHGPVLGEATLAGLRTAAGALGALLGAGGNGAGPGGVSGLVRAQVEGAAGVAGVLLAWNAGSQDGGGRVRPAA